MSKFGFVDYLWAIDLSQDLLIRLRQEIMSSGDADESDEEAVRDLGEAILVMRDLTENIKQAKFLAEPTHPTLN
jgi:hypothetical protein